MSDKANSSKKSPGTHKSWSMPLAFGLALAGPLIAYTGLQAGWLWLAVAGFGLAAAAMAFSAWQA